MNGCEGIREKKIKLRMRSFVTLEVNEVSFLRFFLFLFAVWKILGKVVMKAIFCTFNDDNIPQFYVRESYKARKGGQHLKLTRSNIECSFFF